MHFNSKKRKEEKTHIRTSFIMLISINRKGSGSQILEVTLINQLYSAGISLLHNHSCTKNVYTFANSNTIPNILTA